MNFFGHAAIACWESDDPGFVLGSMLPDWAAITELRIGPIDSDTVRAGVAHHHRVDEVFHRTAVFVERCREWTAALRELGVRRGTARAVSHIGVELILDGWLEARAAAPRYADAVASASPEALGDTIQWQGPPEGHARLRALRERLVWVGRPAHLREARGVYGHLERALCKRPSLAILEEDAAAVRETLDAEMEAVAVGAPALLFELAGGLDLEGPTLVDALVLQDDGDVATAEAMSRVQTPFDP